MTQGRVAILEIDNPPVNAMSQSARRALWDEITRADSEPEIGAIVITARGPDFVTGADLTEIGHKPREPHMPDVVDRIEASSKPVVVAWHGRVLGSGCEIGLAAHKRVMARDARVGLPEVRLGLVPGAGGTQRLPRLVGLPAALDMIATGRMIDAVEAFAIGLCDEVTDGDVRAAAINVAQGLIGKMQPRLSLRAPTPPEPGAWEAMVRRVKQEARARLAPLRVIDLVGQTLSTGFSQGASQERHAFLDLAASDQSRALRHLFLAERRIRHIHGLEGIEAQPIASVGILGSGQVATGIATLCIEQGVPVSLAAGSAAGVQQAREKVATLVARAIRAGRIPAHKQQEIARRVGFTNDWAHLARCDLVIDASADEGPAVTRLRELDEMLPARVPLAVSYPGADWSSLAALVRHPERLIGLHFFAPIPLIRAVELVRFPETTPSCLATVLGLLRRMDRIAVPCRPASELVGNRILARFRQQAEFMLEEGAKPAAIDTALEQFGLALGPFAAQDLAGLDIAWARRRKEERPEGHRSSVLLDALCRLGRFGQKTGRGWYRYVEGRREPDPEVEALVARAAARSGLPQQRFSIELIQMRLLATMANEGARLLAEKVVEAPFAIDLAMVHAFGFPAWQGGPMQAADARGLRSILALAEESANRDGPDYAVAPLLRDLVATGKNFASLNTDAEPAAVTQQGGARLAAQTA